MTLRQTEAQKRAETLAEYADAPEFISKRLRESEKLRDDVEKLLTDQQREALNNDQMVRLSLNDLPKELQQRALDYMVLSAQLNNNVVAFPDLSRRQDFALVFRPLSNGELWRMIGVVTVGSDGTHYEF